MVEMPSLEFVFGYFTIRRHMGTLKRKKSKPDPAPAANTAGPAVFAAGAGSGAIQ